MIARARYQSSNETGVSHAYHLQKLLNMSFQAINRIAWCTGLGRFHPAPQKKGSARTGVP